MTINSKWLLSNYVLKALSKWNGKKQTNEQTKASLETVKLPIQKKFVYSSHDGMMKKCFLVLFALLLSSWANIFYWSYFVLGYRLFSKLPIM